MSFLYHTFTNKSGEEIAISYQDQGQAERKAFQLANNDTAIQVSSPTRTWRARNPQGVLLLELQSQNSNANYIIPASKAIRSNEISAFIIHNKLPYSIKIYSINATTGQGRFLKMIESS